MEISIVIPLYNEEHLIGDLVERTVSVLKGITNDFEIIFVDDGSQDDTVPRLIEARIADSRIKILELSKNFGHQAAFSAGLTFARGRFVVMMDGDLQDPPELIPVMHRMLVADEYDVIFGKRTNKPNLKGRNLLALAFHKTFKRVSGFPDIENVGNFSAMNRDALKALLQFTESIRYLPGLRHFIGFRQGFVEYRREERYKGKSKMNYSNLLALSSDAIFSFSKFPIRLCLYLGIIGILVFFLAGLYTLIAKLAGFAVIGWSSTLLSIYFLGSIQLTFLGIIGEYIFRIYKESQHRPLYFVRKFHD
ncbi:MAG: glycosyltransferase family 2 protein [Bacteroidia bacterium]|nr:glycosyltransferase family 2 protein [Bacteroidia bacterium]